MKYPAALVPTVDGFTLDRTATVKKHRLDDVFHGLEGSIPLTTLYPSARKRRTFLHGCVLEVSPEDLYAYVDDDDGHIVLGQGHLRKSEERVLYLDVLHELVHVKQFHDGLELFDRRFAYVDRPTELEAYELGVREARRIGMKDRDIFEYLEVPWVTAEEMQRLAYRLGVRVT